MNSITTDGESHGYSLAHGWRTLAMAGAVVGLLGLLAMAFPLATGLSLTIGFGALLVLSGVVHDAHAVTARGWRGRIWQAALAAVAVVAGLVAFVNPAVGLVTLTLVLVGYLLADGIAETRMGLRMAGQPGRTSIVASGVVSLVLAGLLWAGFPATASWALGLLVGVSLFVTGLSMGVVAISARRVDESTPPAAEPRGA